MIKIIDNELPDQLVLNCITDAENSKTYNLLHIAGNGSYGFKHNWTFFEQNFNLYIENENLQKLWVEVQKFLPTNIFLIRAYINAHTYGVEDVIHTDEINFAEGITVIVYLCNDWYPEWFGQTIFFNSMDKHNNNIIQSVFPKFNRILIFDKNIPHCVSPLSRRFTGVRFTCMFKIILT